MKKEILILLFLVVISSLAFALDENRTYTQEQLDAINPNTEILGCQNNGHILNLEMRRITYYNSCLKIIKLSDDQYIAKRTTFKSLNMTFGEIKAKFQEVGLIEMIKFFNRQLFGNFLMARHGIKETITQNQTNNLITIFENNVGIDQNKLG